jgi:hypothetical protein
MAIEFTVSTLIRGAQSVADAGFGQDVLWPLGVRLDFLATAPRREENRHMRRRGDFLDARISQRALDLYKLGRGMLRDGVDPSSAERIDVAFGLNRALKLPPWNEVVVDLEAYAINPAKLESALPKRPSSRHARQVRVGPCMDGAHGARRI